MLSKDQLAQIKFTNLVQHSHWTIPVAIGDVKRQVLGNIKKGLHGFALTDHNVMSGTLETYFMSKDKEFFQKHELADFPMMIGARLNFTDDLEVKDLSRIFNLTLLVKNSKGYRNLCYLTSVSSDEAHWFETKRLGIHELIERSEGLTIGSGGIDGMLGQAIVKGTGQEEQLAEIFKDNFGDDFYIEIHYRPKTTHWDATLKKYVDDVDDLQKRVNLRLIEIANKFGIKCCLVQNSYIVDKKHHDLQNILIRNHPEHKKSGWYIDQPYDLMSVEEMYEYIQQNSPYITDEQFLEFTANTQIITNKCRNLKLEFWPALPAIKYNEHPVNLDASYEDKINKLEQEMETFCPLFHYVIKKSRTDISLRTTIKTIIRLEKVDFTKKDEVDLLAFELKVMQLNGVVRLCDYFLLLEDVVNFVRDNGFLRGFGRGSGAGSLLTYAMDISDVQPIKYGLLFERFLTQDRIGTFFFENKALPIQPFTSKEEDYSNPFFAKLQKMMDAKRVKECNSDYLEKEAWFLECNPNVAEYVYNLTKLDEKVENHNHSSMSYVLGITDTLPHQMIDHTETTMPDFDFDTDGRDEVKQFLVEKYGRDHVTLLGTVGTLKTKGAISDILRQLRPNMPFFEVKELTKRFSILNPLEFKAEIEYFKACLEADKTLKSWFDKNPDVLEAVRMLLGNAKSTGVHAGGIIVSYLDVKEVAPLTWDHGDKIWVTQIEMGFAEKIGLIKYDFLGLKTLGDLNRVLKMVNSRYGKNYTLSNIPMDDAEVLKLFAEGKTESVFQFLTDLATQFLLKTSVIRNVEDLAMITSLLRPGPLGMGMDKTFIERSTGKEEVQYLHPTLKSVLSNTYGIVIFQESVIQIVQKIGDFDGSASVDIMKNMSKKKYDKVVKFKDRFIKNAVDKHGYTKEKALELWQLLESFAQYGFNKSHAVAYACVSYLCMWFKHYYPAEWHSAVLSGATKDDFKVLYPKWKDSVNKPDINSSKDTFIIDDKNKVSMPFTAINGVGKKAVETIISGQPFASFEDFYNRVDKRQVNKNTFISLIMSGCFDSFNNSEENSVNKWRKTLILDFFKLRYKDKPHSKAEKATDLEFLKEIANMNRGQMLMREVSLLNFTAFDYFNYYYDQMTDGARKKFGDEAIRPEEVAGASTDSVVIIGGAIESIEIAPIKNKTSKNFGKEMARIKLSNEGHSIDVVVFPNTLAEDDKGGGVIRTLTEYTPIIIKGKVNRWNGSLSVIYDSGLILI